MIGQRLIMVWRPPMLIPPYLEGGASDLGCAWRIRSIYEIV